MNFSAHAVPSSLLSLALLASAACKPENGKATEAVPSATATATAVPTPSASSNASLPTAFERRYAGTLDGTKRVTMRLKRDGAVLTGDYSYVTTGSGKLSLNGALLPDGSFELNETNGSLATGKFSGKFGDGGKLSGTWTDAKGERHLPFEASEASVGGPPETATTLAPHDVDGNLLGASDALPFNLIIGAPTMKDTRDVKTCTELAVAVHDGYIGGIANDQNIVSKQQAACKARRALTEAKVSKASFISGFRLDKDQGDVLPASLKVAISNDDVKAAKRLETEKKSWRAAEPTLKFVSYRAPFATYSNKADDDIRVQILGFGDFDGDGIEDVVLQSSWQGKGGSTSFEGDPLILTRTTADGPMMLVRRIGR